ncbi:MAG TPA: hypothetical protein DCS93_29045 [Microscillaceae bacterium]|nr:hypothetical protein [Microscillaceae bacterium]
MKLFKIAFVVLIHLAFVLKPQELSKSACGGVYEGITYYNFLDPAIINQPANKPFFFTFERLYDYEWSEESGKIKDNLSEWKNYFNNQPSTQDLKKLVYKASVAETNKIKGYVQGTNPALNPQWRTNSAVTYLKGKRATDVVDYLVFAKKCEPFVTAQDYRWDAPSTKDLTGMQDLIIQGTAAYRATSNVFLKMRYGYQLVRLAHYAQKYSQAIALYDQLVKPLEGQSNALIKYWAMAHKAGALMLSNQKAAGARLFAVVFDNCPSRRVQAYASFKVISNAEFQKTLALCKNNREVATVYALRGLKPYANAIEEMQNIYKVAPGSSYLSLLLAREINKLESNLLSSDLSKNLAFYQKFEGYPKQEAVKYLKELQAFIAKSLQERKVKELELWQLATCYLEYVAGKPAAALRKLNALTAKGKKMQRQVQVFKLAMKLAQVKKIDKEAETNLYQQVRLLGHKHLMDYMKNVYRRRLYAQGDIGKAYLCNTDSYSFPIKLEMKILDNLIAWEKRTTNKTPFELSLNSDIKRWYGIKATMYFKQDKLKDAIQYYKLAGSSVKLKANPKFFKIAGNYGHRRPVINKYTRQSLAEEMLRLKNQLKNEDPKIAFELGNIYYNITWFGNTWDALENYRSSSLGYYRYYEAKSAKTPRKYNMTYPLGYFNKAIAWAHQKGDKELAAKAAYMAAKCERRAYEASKGYSYKKATPEKYLSNFKLLRQQYAKTQYYQEIIKECQYYNNFLNR